VITESTLRSEYLDFLNCYLTVELFAEHREISVTLATAIIDEGRKCHEMQPDLESRMDEYIVKVMAGVKC
jgi:uncharacterized protein YeeX (DUF496 family)